MGFEDTRTSAPVALGSQETKMDMPQPSLGEADHAHGLADVFCGKYYKKNTRAVDIPTLRRVSTDFT